MNWYYGPTDYRIIKTYDRNLEDIAALGWGIFGWINRHAFIPMYGFKYVYSTWLGCCFVYCFGKISHISYYLEIILSQAKMKVLLPEIAELGEKFKKEPMKKQQETMKLYNKTGVNL
jgi:YidC/Oxa1 family membrane protein insertase